MITADIIQEAAAIVGRQGSGEAGVAALRAAWPALRFVACSDDDVPPRLEPALSGKGFNLYFVGSGEHCIALTTDADNAIGLVVAEVVEEA